MKQAQVQLLARNNLDLQRWDEAVSRAPYGLSWWLDAVTGGNWYGVVLDDYRTVMPLPVSRSFGPLKFVNGAPFTQHQGPFGDFDDDDIRLMLRAIPRHWYVRKLCLYPAVTETAVAKAWKLTQRTNHELSLQPDGKKLRSSYRTDLRRKLRDFPTAELREWKVMDFLAFYQKHVGPKHQLDDAGFAVLKALTTTARKHNAGKCYHLVGGDGNVIAAIFHVHHGNRIFNLFAASSPQGYRVHGMARLLDGVIQANAASDLILDFEGSDLPGVAMFFRSFGAKRVEYWRLTR